MGEKEREEGTDVCPLCLDRPEYCDCGEMRPVRRIAVLRGGRLVEIDRPARETR